MLSSGGLLSAISFEMSPVVLFAADALVLAFPKRPDIFEGLEAKSQEKRFEGLWKEGACGCQNFQSMCCSERTLLPNLLTAVVLIEYSEVPACPARLRLYQFGAKPYRLFCPKRFSFTRFFSLFTPRSNNRSQSLQKEKAVHSYARLLTIIHTALGESPRTPLAPWSTEKAETHPHKSNFRGSPPPHLFYPHSPFLGCLHSSRFLLGSRGTV